jgi:alpha-beta hydrolase superfamily lysophospholipase
MKRIMRILTVADDEDELTTPDAALFAHDAGAPVEDGAPNRRASREQEMTAAVLEMVLGSGRLTAFGGGDAEVQRILDRIENVWLDHAGTQIHLDLHRSEQARATVVFQPGSGAHARVYFLLGALLARRGYHMLAIDRPGHGLSGGETGDCTIEEAIAVAGAAIDYARRALQLPVVLMGSSLGGLLTIFALLKGIEPDLAVAHNFVYPGKLVSMRLRARWIARYRTRPYPLTELVHGFERLSDDPAISRYLTTRVDPGFAWQLSARSVASLFAFRAGAAAGAPETLVVSGDSDKAIPAWATRLFAWWSGLPRYEVQVIPRAGHLLFHDHLDRSVPLITGWLDARLTNRGSPSRLSSALDPD